LFTNYWEFLHPSRYSWRSIYTSVPDNESAFTEKRSSINSFIIATSTNGHNSKSNPSNKRFSNSQWGSEHNDTQDLWIRALIHWLSRQSITCIILLLDFCIFSHCFYIAVYYKTKYCCAYIDGILKLGHIYSRNPKKNLAISRWISWTQHKWNVTWWTIHEAVNWLKL